MKKLHYLHLDESVKALDTRSLIIALNFTGPKCNYNVIYIQNDVFCRNELMPLWHSRHNNPKYKIFEVSGASGLYRCYVQNFNVSFNPLFRKNNITTFFHKKFRLFCIVSLEIWTYTLIYLTTTKTQNSFFILEADVHSLSPFLSILLWENKMKN